MNKYKLRNQGRVIGTAKSNNRNIKRLPKNIKYSLGALLVGGGIAATVLATGNKDKDVEVDKIIEESLLDSNDIFRADTYMIPQDNGDILFVTSNYLNDHNYVPNDTIDTRYDFIIDFNDKVQKEYKKTKPELDFTAFDKEYQNFRMIYEEYIDGDQQDSFFQKNYVLETEEHLIETIHSFDLISYVPTAIPYEDYIITTIPQGEKKYTIDYEIPKDTSLSEILSYTDNKQEYKETKEEVVNNPNNNITNEDLIYAGATLELPNLDEGDLTDLGYAVYTTPADELDQRYTWINQMYPTIDVLSGDSNSNTNLQSLGYAIGQFNQAYDAYIAGDESVSLDILYDARKICDSIDLLTGVQFEPTPIKVR